MMNYMKKLAYCLILLLFLFTSCKSKKTLVVSPAISKLVVDSLRPDTTDLLSGLFVPDHSQLKELPTKRKQKKRPAKPATRTSSVPAGVAPGTLITRSEVGVSSVYKGVDRIVKYSFTHRDVPEAFENFRIAFISDLHYKSLFEEKELDGLVRLLKTQQADVLFLGGDYQEGCEYVPELFAALAKVKTPMGTYGVMGNNDYERCHEDIVREMQKYGMQVLEHKVDTLKKDGQQILVAGVRNPFDLKQNGHCPTLDLAPEDFVILLVHTPDYIEDVSVANTDLALAGHTHGGQVRILGYAPIIPSHYGSRFLTGLKYNTAQIPMIVTNGLGTSNKNIRIGAPTEIVIVTLHRLKQ